MKKYIIHYPILKERKEYIQSLIDNAQLKDITWVSKWSKENEMQSLTNAEPRYSPTTEDWSNKCKNYYGTVPTFRKLRPGEISCFLNHFFAWEQISKYGDGLILEDDAIFCDDFENKLSKAIESTAKFDALFIGGLFHHEDVAKTISINGNLYRKSHPSTNTTCAYVLKKDAAIKLVSAVKNYSLPSDFELNYWFDELNFDIYHFIPYLIKEGSGNGKYKSSLDRESMETNLITTWKKALISIFSKKIMLP